jgi:hypothetical protein
VQRLLAGCVLLLAACGPIEAGTPTPAPARAASPTPRPSASPTPQPTATAVPTATAPPRFYTEAFDGGLPDWSVLQANTDAAPRTQLRDGLLLFHLDQPFDWAYAVIGAHQYADVRIDALVQSQAATPDAIGVICRYDEQAGWYEFNVSADRSYNVLYGQWLAEGVARYTPIAFDRSEYLNPGGADNEIGMACQGTTLWLYINGRLFRKLNETRFALTEGKVGLSVSSFENTPVTAAFDWVRVGEPTEP